MNLFELGRKYDSLKCRDKYKGSAWHFTKLVYPRYLEERRNSIENVLEIGVWKGGSLYMFRDYFPNAKIWGLDIDPKFEIHDERIDVLIGDQKDQKVLEHISEVGPFDVIIDDAGHEFKEQSASFENLWTCLKPNGIYFIEDLQFNDEIVKYLAGLVSPDTVKKKNDIKSISFYRNIAVLEKAVREEDE